MKILQRFLTVGLLKNTMLALFVLVVLFAFFSLIDQLEDAGRGNYGVLQAVTYVILTMPRLAYELAPIAAVVGSMSLLGLMVQSSELPVIRTSGVSRLQLALLLARGGLLIVVIMLLVGEVVAPIGEERAQNMKSIALTKQITLKSRYGFWARDGDSFVNIRKVLSGREVEQIYIYEFDHDGRLRNSTFARRAKYDQDKWLLENIQQTKIDGQTVMRSYMKHATWESLLNPDVLELVIVQPRNLSIIGLYRYVKYLRQNAQNSVIYEQSLWIKLARPFAIIAMIMLAVPLLGGYSRTTPVAHRIFVGALVGIVFHSISETAGHLGVVWNLPPPVSAMMPTVLLLGLIGWLLRD